MSIDLHLAPQTALAMGRSLTYSMRHICRRDAESRADFHEITTREKCSILRSHQINLIENNYYTSAEVSWKGLWPHPPPHVEVLNLDVEHYPSVPQRDKPRSTQTTDIFALVQDTKVDRSNDYEYEAQNCLSDLPYIVLMGLHGGKAPVEDSRAGIVITTMH